MVILLGIWYVWGVIGNIAWHTERYDLTVGDLLGIVFFGWTYGPLLALVYLSENSSPPKWFKKVLKFKK